MKRFGLIGALICLVMFVYGCKPTDTADEDSDSGSTAVPSTNSTASARDPRAAQTVEQFLKALSSGDTETATAMLSEKARIENEKAGMSIDPPGSASAKYSVNTESWFDPDEPVAQVSSTWTDRDSRDVVQTYEIVWLLKQEENDWKITGMATKVFSDQPPILLNFENPQQMQQERQRALQQVADRARQNRETTVANQTDQDGQPIRR